MKTWSGLTAAVLLALAGCSNTVATNSPAPGLASGPESLRDMTTAGLCREWQRALDGYEVSRIRKEIAGELTARGEDPETCTLRAGARPERPSISRNALRASSGSAVRSSRTLSRPAFAASAPARGPGIKANAEGSLTCTSELVKGPPDRYKTVCR